MGGGVLLMLGFSVADQGFVGVGLVDRLGRTHMVYK
jgi:hypothetical protein